jgi:hypothetical protein
MQWPVVDLTEWEELRQCPTCGQHWFSAWPEEVEGGMVVCLPEPRHARRLREVDRASTLRGYCLARLEEHYGTLREVKPSCRKVGCEGRRVGGTPYCIEHLIADRFGRHLARLASEDDD